MLHLSVRTKILSLVALFSFVIVALNVSSALSSRSVSFELNSLSSKSLTLVKNLEKSRQLLLNQSVEFERGFFQVSIAKSMGGYGTEQIAESADKFKAYTLELEDSIGAVKQLLTTMPADDSLDELLAAIELLTEQQAIFLEASNTTYEWWVKLKTLQANKARRLADESLLKVNEQMTIINTLINDYNSNITNNQTLKQDQTIIASAILAAILISIGLVISIIIINGICNPLKNAVKRAEEIASGELTQGAVNSSRKDEIGMLETAMDRLVMQLSSILHDVAESSDSLTAAAHNLNKITDSSSSMIETQQAETAQISQSIIEIQSTAKHVSSSTAEASVAAQDAEQAAIEGRKIVSDTIHSIEQLAQELSLSASTINELQNNTNEISTILNVILGIAEQTNLLALNAAIEAARAGEQGRGFAVVADEVRHLAQNTQNATQQIEQMISLLQTGTQSAVKAITTSHERSTNVVNQVRNEEHSLENINQCVSQIRGMNDRISATALQQASVTTEVSRNIANIGDIANKTTNSIHSISQSAEQLETLATQLSTKIGYFKV